MNTTTNSRNQHGFKDSINCYLTIKGDRYEQWSDFDTKEDCQKENPGMVFITRKVDDFTRVYYKVD